MSVRDTEEGEKSGIQRRKERREMKNCKMKGRKGVKEKGKEVEGLGKR